MKKKTLNIVTIVLFTFIISCKKDWLDEKPILSQVVPETVEDMQAILDSDEFMNGGLFGGSSAYPGAGELSADYLTLAGSGTAPTYSSISDFEKSVYTWQTTIPPSGSRTEEEWTSIYRSIFYANVVLDGVEKLIAKNGSSSVQDELKGAALFYRSMGFFNASQLYAKPYDAATAGNDLGVPLKLKGSVDEPVSRSSVAITYARIVDDLKLAESLAPLQVSFKTRPSRAAVRGLLARVYLVMGDYANGLLYTEKYLQDFAELLDYNTLPTTATSSFTRYNKEVIFHSVMKSYAANGAGKGVLIDPVLVDSFDDNDLRKKLFFIKLANDQYNFKGNYSGTNSAPFTGIATDEIYLIKAECLARLNRIAEAMTTLNTLMITRWDKNATYVPFQASSETQALNIILAERKKEIIFRGLRWTDLRRLNKDDRFKKTLTRSFTLGTELKTFTLPPNDLRYVLPIPAEVIQLSGMQQNER